jgi:hypothetical protein
LMNKELILKKWKESNDPAFLAWSFQVSITAMTIRLTQLGLLNTLT